MADWLRCADGGGEGGPGHDRGGDLLRRALAAHLTCAWSRTGDAAVVVAAGAGRSVHGRWALRREVGRLRDDPALLATMRSASAGLGRPAAADEVAALVVDVLSTERGCRHGAR